jgi:hypothetical protein
MLQRKPHSRSEVRTAAPTVFVRSAHYREAMDNVETLSRKIEQIVVERQELRASGAAPAALEENRRRLGSAQAQLSRLLIERYLPRAESA